MRNNKHNLPYELEDIRGDSIYGELMPFSESEADSFGQYDTFIEGPDLYLGDGKNIYQVRKRLLEDDELVLTAECVGVCNPEEYCAIMENEDGFGSVVGYVESDFAFYTEEDRFLPSPAESGGLDSNSFFGSKEGDRIVSRSLKDQ